MNVIEILDKIEENGFEAYIVGGYVRDYVLGLSTNDIDICTNARVKEIMDIFDNMNPVSNEYGSVKIITNDLRIDITTYRRDLKYNGSRRKVEIEYVDNLIEDVKRRDFTMNTLCMSKDGHIIDLFNGQEDIKNKIIRCVGNVKDRLNEDPLRILRAIRFATTLDFKIEEGLYKELKKNNYLIEQLSLERIKEELTKILVNKNALKGLEMLNELGILPYMGIEYNKDMVYVSDICGMYSQLNIKEFPFSKKEKDNINSIKNILKYGMIDENILFEYGLYLSMVAGEILGIDKEIISIMYNNLVISSIKDIKVTTKDICNILNVKPSKVIGLVYNELKELILKRELSNNSDSIKEYLINNRKKWLNEGAII